MQVQSLNSYQPDFQALKLSSITKNAKKIDIYSLTSEDKTFAKKMLNVAKSQVFPQDNKLLGELTTREVYDKALKKVGQMRADIGDRVFIAVENDNQITGILNVSGKGDSVVDGLAIWNNDNLTRDSLVVTALKDTQHAFKDFTALILPTAQKNRGVKDYFRRLGFVTPKDFGNKNLMVEGDKLSEAIPKAQKVLDAKVHDYNYKNKVNLEKIFNLEA